MHIVASASSLPHNSFDYSPKELETMRLAFRRACEENPELSATAEQRYVLAQAIVNRFEDRFTETELIAVALRQAN